MGCGPAAGSSSDGRRTMKKYLTAATVALTLASAGSAVADPAYSRIGNGVGHAANSSGSDYNTHIYACDTKDDGHEVEGQMWMGHYTTYVRDSAGGSCAHSYQSTKIQRFRACKLALRDTCGGWVTPRR